MGTGDTDERATDGRIGDDLLPRFDRDTRRARRGEFGMVRIHGGQRLGHGESLRCR